MKKCLVSIVFCCLVASHVTAQTTAQSIVNGYKSQYPSAAISMGVIEKDTVTLEYYDGLKNINDTTSKVDSNTIYSLGSIGKLVTGAAIMTLIDQGRLELNDKASKLLGFTVDKPTDDSITIQQLLTHTSAISDNNNVLVSYFQSCDRNVPLDSVVFDYLNVNGANYSSASFASHATGSAWEYANMNFVTLAAIVEAVSGKDFETYCNEHIFKPLCIENAYWRPSDIPINDFALPHSLSGSTIVTEAIYCLDIYPAGQLSMTMFDLGRFLKGFKTNDTALFTNGAQDLIFQTYFNVPAIGLKQGLAWYSFDYLGATYWGHNGGIVGVNTNMYWNRTDDIAYITVENMMTENEDLVFEMIEANNLEQNAQRPIVCEPQKDTTVIDTSVDNSIDQLVDNAKFMIYPNPSSHNVVITTEHDAGIFSIYSVHGKLMEEIYVDKSYQLNVSFYPRGLYIIREENGTGSTFSVQ